MCMCALFTWVVISASLKSKNLTHKEVQKTRRTGMDYVLHMGRLLCIPVCCNSEQLHYQKASRQGPQIPISWMIISTVLV